jgi:hypothetical protein
MIAIVRIEVRIVHVGAGVALWKHIEYVSGILPSHHLYLTEIRSS